MHILHGASDTVVFSPLRIVLLFSLRYIVVVVPIVFRLYSLLRDRLLIIIIIIIIIIIMLNHKIILIRATTYVVTYIRI